MKICPLELTLRNLLICNYLVSEELCAEAACHPRLGGADGVSGGRGAHSSSETMVEHKVSKQYADYLIFLNSFGILAEKDKVSGLYGSFNTSDEACRARRPIGLVLA